MAAAPRRARGTGTVLGMDRRGHRFPPV